MQTIFKFLELIDLDNASTLNISRTAIPTKTANVPCGDQEKRNFLDYLEALLSMPAEQAKLSMEHLEWIRRSAKEGSMIPDFALDEHLSELPDGWRQILTNGLPPSEAQLPLIGFQKQSMPTSNWTLETNHSSQPESPETSSLTAIPFSADDGPIINTGTPAQRIEVVKWQDHPLFRLMNAKNVQDDMGLEDQEEAAASIAERKESGLKQVLLEVSRPIQTEPPGSQTKQQPSQNFAATGGMDEKSFEKPVLNHAEITSSKTKDEKASVDLNTKISTVRGEPLRSHISHDHHAPSTSERNDREGTVGLERREAAKVPQDDGAAFSYRHNGSGNGGQETQNQLTRDPGHSMEVRPESLYEKSTHPTELKQFNKSEAAPKSLQHDIMRQIVQRMTLRSIGGQSQMSIQLKPEFLGNLKLHIITENQNVMIKMTAASAVVKEMIEHNFSILKTELQQHGLNIDKLDVFVGQEHDASKQRDRQAASRQGRYGSIRKMAGMEGQDQDAGHEPIGFRPSAGFDGRSHLNEIDFFA